jgi:hypothetical protein
MVVVVSTGDMAVVGYMGDVSVGLTRRNRLMGTWDLELGRRLIIPMIAYT